MGNRKLIVANLKMNQTLDELGLYLNIINKKIDSRQVVMCPTSIYIPYFLKQNYRVGLQNTFLRSKGSYTGEISPLQASKMGITYTILGHSERRMYFDEGDMTINKKIVEALKYHLRVILCIGENQEEKDLRKTERVLRRQLMYGLRGIEEEDLKRVIIAYEPVWASVKDQVITSPEILDTVSFIKGMVRNMEHGVEIRVLYGGPIDLENIEELNEIENLDGFLIEDSALDPKKLVEIIEKTIR